jgi:adenylate cyclase
MAKSRKFVPLTRKVNSIILISLILGIGSITPLLLLNFTRTINKERAQRLLEQAATLSVAVDNLMLDGEAGLVIETFEDFNTIQAVSGNTGFQINLYKRDGMPAFLSTVTRDEVNARLAETSGSSETFLPREMFSFKVPEIEDDYFQRVIQNPVPEDAVSFSMIDDGRYRFRVYRYLMNLPRCDVCHGADHTVRGVLHISTDVHDSVVAQQQLVIAASGSFLILILVLSAILSRFLRNAVITPVRIVGDVCLKVTEGNFESRVPESSNDEIGILSRTVNKMVEGLYERFALSKYVSTSTIESIHETESGSRKTMTLFFSDIRGFTSYTEKHTAEAVVSRLNNIISKQTEIIHKYKGDIDKYVGDEVVAMFRGENAEEHACKAAVEIQEALSDSAVKKSLYDNLEVGIGINKGEVILGVIGSEKRADFTSIGDSVNVTSRLCSAAEGGEILISDNIYSAVRTMSSVDGPFKLKAKGKSQFIKVYKLTGLTSDDSGGFAALDGFGEMSDLQESGEIHFADVVDDDPDTLVEVDEEESNEVEEPAPEAREELEEKEEIDQPAEAVEVIEEIAEAVEELDESADLDEVEELDEVEDLESP